MKTTVLTALIVAGASAGVAALTTSLLVDTRSGPERSASIAAPPPAQMAAGQDVSELVRGLREENLALQQRIEELEALVAREIASRVPVEAPGAPAKGAAGPAAQVATLLGDGSGELPPAFVASVGQALKEIRDEEDRQREVKRSEERSARIEQRLTELQEELGLSGYQVTEMRGALTTLEEKRDALRQSLYASGGDRREMFEAFRTLYEETSAQLQTILTPEQFAQYQQSDRGRFGGFGRRGDGGGPPGFPGGGPTGGR
jgi:DNA repair exonuclease SbcCD ATPase subunit